MNNYEDIMREFDSHFGKIVQLNPREPDVITDITGHKFYAVTDDDGKITSFGGLSSIKHFILITLQKEREKILKMIEEIPSSGFGEYDAGGRDFKDIVISKLK